MPNYVKFMKDILSKKKMLSEFEIVALTKKKMLSEFEIVALTKECNASLQNKIPLKMKDPRRFTISCNIGESYCGKALCDLGARINLMEKSSFKMLGIGEVRSTAVTLQLTD
ncbi:uncharacterized protein [Gossypium hirsutum]|uniref:Gag-asp_proteas domain-containing protein n=1 Tax=Gossypium hirsutum TaxID=3635 RepID=A0A1U8NBR8_GOSHI|nr:uncharacterized protein LOC107946560 [Gossypium hirsutum]